MMANPELVAFFLVANFALALLLAWRKKNIFGRKIKYWEGILAFLAVLFTPSFGLFWLMANFLRLNFIADDWGYFDELNTGFAFAFALAVHVCAVTVWSNSHD